MRTEALKAWLCMVKTNPHDHHLYKVRMMELKELSQAAGYDIVGSTIQVNKKENVAFVVGKGKLEEIRQQVVEKKIDTVIFYNTLTSKQRYNLERMLGTEVLDRYDLTLKIFDISSSDKASKIQIKLARLLKEIPYQKLLASIRFKTGREHPGPRGLGEYAYHEIIANLLKRKSLLEEEIERMQKEKIMQLERRRRLGIPTVCITGYYNAGKTSLFNALTNLKKPVSPRPFTTLTSKYYLIPYGNLKIFLVDTIGFVMDLDPRLIEAFGLTLEDIKLSDVIVLTVDISDPLELMFLKVKTCLDFLNILFIDKNRIVIAFNKYDLVETKVDAELRIKKIQPLIQGLDYCIISAKEKTGFNDLFKIISSKILQLCKNIEKSKINLASDGNLSGSNKL
ncbi:MAG: GTPase [Nitrososphaerota archaeon]|nr:GTPase [Nitrososphaerota archaeon]